MRCFVQKNKKREIQFGLLGAIIVRESAETPSKLISTLFYIDVWQSNSNVSRYNVAFAVWHKSKTHLLLIFHD